MLLSKIIRSMFPIALENVCCLSKSLRLVFVANIFCKLDYVAYKLLLINHTVCSVIREHDKMLFTTSGYFPVPLRKKMFKIT